MFKPESTFHVLYISSVAETEKFYSNIGAEIVELKNDKVVINVGDYNFHCILDSTEPWQEYKYAAKNENRGQGVLFYIEVEDLEKAFELVKTSGGNIKSEIKENWWGANEFLFEDINGYKFVFYKMN